MNKNELRDYKKDVIRYMASNSSAAFTNKGKNHAAIVAGTIFQNVEEYLYIFTSNLNSDVSELEEFFENFKDLVYTKKNISIKILLENYDKNNLSKALDFIIKESKNNKNIQIKEMIHCENAIKMGHLILADDKMIRLETEASNYEALCSFNYDGIDIFKTAFLNLFDKFSKDI